MKEGTSKPNHLSNYLHVYISKVPDMYWIGSQIASEDEEHKSTLATSMYDQESIIFKSHYFHFAEYDFVPL